MNYENNVEFEILREYIKKNNNISYESVIKHFESKEYGKNIENFDNCIVINKKLIYTTTDEYVIFSDKKNVQLIDLKDNKIYCTKKGYYDKNSECQFKFFIEGKNESYDFYYQNNRLLLNLENKSFFINDCKLISIEETENKSRYNNDIIEKERIDYLKLNFKDKYKKDIRVTFENKNLIVNIDNFCKLSFLGNNTKLTFDRDVFYSISNELREIENKDDSHIIDTNKITDILLGQKEFSTKDILLEIKNFTDLAHVMFDSKVKNIENFINEVIEILPLKEKVENFIKNNKILFEELDEEEINFKNHLFSNLSNKGFDSDLTFKNNGTYTPERITSSVFKDMLEEVKDLSKMLNMDYNIKIKSEKKVLLNIQDN